MILVVPKHITRLVYNYINNFSDPGEFSRMVSDDPEFGSKKGIGLKHAIAQAVYEYRIEFVGGKFTNIEQISNIEELDQDTAQDIIYTFSDNDTPTELVLTKAEIRTLNILSQLLTADYGEATVAASLAAKGVNLSSSQIKMLVYKSKSMPHHDPENVATALIIPSALATLLVEGLGDEDVDPFYEEEEEEPEFDAGWLEWLENIERAEQEEDDLERPTEPSDTPEEEREGCKSRVREYYNAKIFRQLNAPMPTSLSPQHATSSMHGTVANLECS